jgi:DNA-binding transcriptional ArsR family regulator
MMTESSPETPFEALDRLFHEPNRLAIVSTLCAADAGLSFTELRDRCNLTDGNLNRHLKVLEEAGAVRVKKQFVAGKPLTRVAMTVRGREQFAEYLAVLHTVLKDARKALRREEKSLGAARRSRAPAT